MAVVVVTMPGVAEGQHVPDFGGESVTVLAADGGLELALALNLTVDVVVGDLDSASPESLRAAVAVGASVEQHPADKDQTDLELSLQRAVRESPERIVLLGGGGGRLDHLIGNLAAIAGVGAASRDHSSDLRLEAWLGTTLVVPVHGSWHCRLVEGSTLSIVAWGSPAHVRVRGVRWPLDDEWLEPDQARGLSNESVGPVTSIDVSSGMVLVVVPDAALTLRPAVAA